MSRAHKQYSHSDRRKRKYKEKNTTEWIREKKRTGTTPKEKKSQYQRRQESQNVVKNDKKINKNDRSRKIT